MAAKIINYIDNGVKISKKVIRVGDKVKLAYNGLLFKSGADRIFAHIGYNDTWENREFIPMEVSGDSVETEIDLLAEGILNISFKDSANNWDNNSSDNYRFKVYKKIQRSTSIAPEKTKSPFKQTTEKIKASKTTSKSKKTEENE